MGLENEIWKTINGFSKYQISNLGRVRNFMHHNNTYYMSPMKRGYEGNKYEVVRITGDDGHRENFAVHRLVAKYFVENPDPDNYKIINHKDEDKLNNQADNLEWCDYHYNNTYNNKNIKAGAKLRNRPDLSKPVDQYTKDDVFLRSFPSLMEAARYIGKEKNASGIYYCCNKENYKGDKVYTSYGFIWKWHEGN